MKSAKNSVDDFVMRITKDFPPKDDPIAVAERFAALMRASGYEFDFSLRSLTESVDLWLDKNQFHGNDPDVWCKEARLEAYIGEATRRLFNGEWQGSFSEQEAGTNYYLSFVRFGDYLYRPSHYIGYRSANGRDSAGTFAAHFAGKLPLIESRIEAW